MIVRRIVFAALAIGLLCASASAAVFAAAFAVYALLRDPLTPPGAAGAVILVMALIAGAGALILFRSAKLPSLKAPRRTRAPAEGPSDVLMGLVKDRPLIAGGVGLAAGLLALANPKIITAVLKAFTDSDRPGKRRAKD